MCMEQAAHHRGMNSLIDWMAEGLGHDFIHDLLSGSFVDEAMLHKPLMRLGPHRNAGGELHQLDDATALVGFVVEEGALRFVNALAALAAESQLAGF